MYTFAKQAFIFSLNFIFKKNTNSDNDGIKPLQHLH